MDSDIQLKFKPMNELNPTDELVIAGRSDNYLINHVLKKKYGQNKGYTRHPHCVFGRTCSHGSSYDLSFHYMTIEFTSSGNKRPLCRVVSRSYSSRLLVNLSMAKKKWLLWITQTIEIVISWLSNCLALSTALRKLIETAIPTLYWVCRVPKCHVLYHIS